MVSYDYEAGKAVMLPDAARALLEGLKVKGPDGGPDRGQTPV
jgi:hypothetical protein